MHDKSNLSKEVLILIIQMGRAYEKVLVTLDNTLFNNTSKHATYWQSTNEEFDEKLDDIRRCLMTVQDNLYEIRNLLDVKEELE